MKRSTLICFALYLVVLCRNEIVVGQDRWSPNPMQQGGYSAPNRGLFGLPMPQQWQNSRPSGVRRYGPYDGMTQLPANCPNGRCGNTGYSANNCVGGRCATSACPNGNCSTGYGAVGNCVNGQCSTGACRNGQCGPAAMMNSRCPGGVCPQGVDSGWSPRSAISGPADPFRRVDRDAEFDQWQQTSRPEYLPLRDNYRPSNYRSNDFDLRSDYFNDASSRSLPSRDDWSRPSSRRSLEAPVERSRDLTRI